MVLEDTNSIITSSLAPAVALSGIGMLTLGLSNRITTVGTRVRELNRELRDYKDPERLANIRRQIPLFLRRAYLIRNALFLLLGSMGMMVFTALFIALAKLYYVEWELLPSWTFVGGLLLLLGAVIIEGVEITLNLKTLNLDVSHSIAISGAEEDPEKSSG